MKNDCAQIVDKRDAERQVALISLGKAPFAKAQVEKEKAEQEALL